MPNVGLGNYFASHTLASRRSPMEVMPMKTATHESWPPTVFAIGMGLSVLWTAFLAYWFLVLMRSVVLPASGLI